MSNQADIVVFGTGHFAARIVLDLAATADEEVSIVVAGRNAARAAWIRTAAAARASMFGRRVRVVERILPALDITSVSSLLAELKPKVVANTASAQGGRVAITRPDRWTSFVEEGGLTVTAIFQARISLAVAQAVSEVTPESYFVNCCYPDVVNGMIAGAGLPIACGIGNVAILAHAFAGALGPGHGRLQLLAQHKALMPFRNAPSTRTGRYAPRVWLDGHEIHDVHSRFSAVQLAPEPVIDISGASGVPLFLAMAAGRDWRGHAPGPLGLPGGYPIRLQGGVLDLDLPDGLSREEAIAWNAAFEQANGLVVDANGQVHFTGAVEAIMRSVSPALADGFAMRDFAAADVAMTELRARLQS